MVDARKVNNANVNNAMNMQDKQGDAPNWRTVFSVPIIIGLLSMSGLLSALLFDGMSRYFSWMAVGAPIILIAWLFARRLLGMS